MDALKVLKCRNHIREFASGLILRGKAEEEAN